MMSKWGFHAGCAVLLMLGLVACSKQAETGTDNISGAANTGGAVASNGQPQAGQAPNGTQYAQVTNVVPIRQEINNPQKVCHDEVVQRVVPPKDEHQIAGTAIGAVAGGLLGHMVGHGKGNTLATVAGAIGGGYAGKRIEESRQQANVQSEVIHRCNTVANSSSKIVAYDVTYVYNGVTRTTRMDHDPGSHVQIEQSVQVVADKP